MTSIYRKNDLIMNLNEQYSNYTKDWEKRINEDEGYFVKFTSKIIDNIQGQSAFEMIDEAVELVLDQSDEFLCLEAFELILLPLVVASNTTQIPVGLETNWNRLNEHVAAFGDYHKSKLRELHRWYHKLG